LAPHRIHTIKLSNDLKFAAKPNPFDLHDMPGNVSELVADC
jgi:formylglycine-generating enzyme required for sulfatase activity